MSDINKVKNIALIYLVIISVLIPSCKSLIIEKIVTDPYKEYLTPNPESEELFRVLIISDRYDFSQMNYADRLNRIEDSEGDKKTMIQLKEYDKINESCEAVLSVWLYPDSGAIMKIRPKTIAPIVEVNTLILEDIKRWHFNYNGSAVDPNVFDVKYKVVLRKIQSDEEIMKELMERNKKDEKKTNTGID